VRRGDKTNMTSGPLRLLLTSYAGHRIIYGKIEEYIYCVCSRWKFAGLIKMYVYLLLHIRIYCIALEPLD